MALTILAKKIGMTRVFSEDGKVSMPVTVLEVKPSVVTQLRTAEVDGYNAVQVGWGDMKARNSTIPQIGHDAKAGTGPKRVHLETRVDEAELGNYELGQEVGLEQFEGVKYVDVSGISKGKGFAGGMKRWGFKGQLASHGVERKHRSPGSIGGHGNNAGKSGRIKKGKKMAGQTGNKRITTRSLDIVRLDTEKNLMLVKGPVPGANGGTVQVRQAVRLNRSKGKGSK